ncbi:hypothetical protein [Microbacterium sp. KRD172]|uniref:hypothetical protein n=1 Tax=Microbacterium sp. KRD172 TaxID=2729727 RepID=UPI0019D188DA|nr:hypothetical protein [Microbacterium sp. KRD172]
MPTPSSLRPRTKRPRWNVIIENDPRDPASGCSLDDVLANDILHGRRDPLLRLWQTDERALLIAADASASGSPVIEASGVHRVTGGGQWLAPGPAAILWSVIANEEALLSAGAANVAEAATEWALASLRQLGLQASVREDGAIMTPMGPVGVSSITRRTFGDAEVLIAQGMIDYAIEPADRAATELLGGDTENVRSQSGLPLPLVRDRFMRMARTLYLARPLAIPPDEEKSLTTEE